MSIRRDYRLTKEMKKVELCQNMKEKSLYCEGINKLLK